MHITNLISQKLMTKENLSVNCSVIEQSRPNDRYTTGNLNKQ